VKCWTVCGRKKAQAAQVRAMAAADVTVVVAAVVQDVAARRAATVIAKAMAAHVRPSRAMIL
jgi:hypothetical protein